MAHKKFLSDYFAGEYPGSLSRGELYNSDPTSGDTRQCGTTASLCGIEAAFLSDNKDLINQTVECDLMLHAYMMTQSGIPVIYSGDEIGTLNDYSYKNDVHKAVDSRYLHRGKFDQKLADKRKKRGTVQKSIFDGITKSAKLRKKYDVFTNEAAVWTVDTHDTSVLCIIRAYGGHKLVGIFNFSKYIKTAWINEPGSYKDLFTGKKMKAQNISLLPYEFFWLYE